MLATCVLMAAVHVEGQKLISDQTPKIVLTASPDFRYVGSVPFRLAESEGERYVFVDADEKKALRRLLIIQLERFLPSSKEIFRYDLSSGREMAGLRFVSNTFAFPGAKEPVAAPKNEAERTNDFLLAHGFTMPAVWLAARHVTIADGEKRKHEMIVFYMEGRSDLVLTDLYAGDEPTAAWTREKPGLEERSRASFALRSP